MDALDLIDFNCWEEVFRKLNAVDLLNCSQVCKPFHKLVNLERFKAKTRFHRILPLLFPYFKSRDDWGRECWHRLFNLRLTCSCWKQSVDKYASEVYQYQAQSLFPEITDIPLLTYFQDSQEIQEFREKFGESNMNPFPSRTVYIYNKEEDATYIENVTGFLQHFGMNIFKLALSFDLYLDLGALDLCKLIRVVTIHLRSLKVFIIDHETVQYDDEQEVANYIRDNALEALPKLEALEIWRLDKAVMDYLLGKFAPQLIHFQRSNSRHQILLDQVHVQQFKNLRKLSLEILEPRWETLEILRFLESPLKSLKLSRTNYYTRQFAWRIDKVLGNLKHLPIDYLEMEAYGVNVIEEGLHPEEYNESIRTLRLHLKICSHQRHCKISFNFLQAMRNLEKMEFHSTHNYPTTHPQEVAEVVRLNEYLVAGGVPDMIYQSNVWERVASLQTLTVRRGWHEVKSTYTREKYEKIIH